MSRWRAVFLVIGLGFTQGLVLARPVLSETNLVNVVQLARNNWLSLSSDAGRFSVQFPIEPAAEVKNISVQGNVLDWEKLVALEEDERYAIAYADLPLEVIEAGREAVLQDLSDQLLTDEFDWKAIENQGRKLSQGDIPGIGYVNVRDGKISVIRLFLAKRRLYAVFASSNNINHIDQFLDSFEIAPAWQTFISESGGFEVALPLAPTASLESTQYQGEPLNWRKFESRDIHNKEDSYAIAYADLSDRINLAQPEDALDKLANIVLRELGVATKVQEGHDLSSDDQPGREFIGMTPQGEPYVIRFYLVDQRLYGVFARSRSLNNLDQFFDSFQLNPVQTNGGR